MIRPAKALAPLLATCALSACASPDTWQVVGIATEPGLPTSVAGTSNFQLRGDRLKGATPCAEVEGSASLADATLQLHSLTIGPVADEAACTGAERHTHEQLVSLLQPGAAFDVRDTGPTERLLVLRTDAVDRPSVRVMTLAPQ